VMARNQPARTLRSGAHLVVNTRSNSGPSGGGGEEPGHWRRLVSCPQRRQKDAPARRGWWADGSRGGLPLTSGDDGSLPGTDPRGRGRSRSRGIGGSGRGHKGSSSGGSSGGGSWVFASEEGQRGLPEEPTADHGPRLRRRAPECSIAAGSSHAVGVLASSTENVSSSSGQAHKGARRLNRHSNHHDSLCAARILLDQIPSTAGSGNGPP
jgi:hypothetical protein